jgi:hypothetical protein
VGVSLSSRILGRQEVFIFVGPVRRDWQVFCGAASFRFCTCTQEGNPASLAAVGVVRMTLNGSLHFSCRWLYFLGKPDLPFGGRELFRWCQRAVVTENEHVTKGESEEK